MCWDSYGKNSFSVPEWGESWFLCVWLEWLLILFNIFYKYYYTQCRHEQAKWLIHSYSALLRVLICDKMNYCVAVPRVLLLMNIHFWEEGTKSISFQCMYHYFRSDLASCYLVIICCCGNWTVVHCKSGHRLSNLLVSALDCTSGCLWFFLGQDILLIHSASLLWSRCTIQCWGIPSFCDKHL